MSNTVTLLTQIFSALEKVVSFVKKRMDTNRRDDIADDSSKLLVDKLGGKSDVKQFNSTNSDTKEQSSSDN